jgi:hypothetical protein
VGHRRAPSRRLRDRTRLKHTPNHTTTALRAPLAALMGPMHVLRRVRALARVVRPRARRHAGALGRARSRAGIRSPSACARARERLSFFFFFFSHAFISLRTEVARQGAKLACASSGSWVLF